MTTTLLACHTKSIQRKLDCTNSASAVTRAFELGILRV